MSSILDSPWCWRWQSHHMVNCKPTDLSQLVLVLDYFADRLSLGFSSLQWWGLLGHDGSPGNITPSISQFSSAYIGEVLMQRHAAWLKGECLDEDIWTTWKTLILLHPLQPLFQELHTEDKSMSEMQLESSCGQDNLQETMHNSETPWTDLNWSVCFDQ